MSRLYRLPPWIIFSGGFLLGIEIFNILILKMLYLEQWSYVSQLVIAGLAAVALYQYRYQKKKDRIEAAIKLYDVTTEQLIPEGAELHIKITESRKADMPDGIFRVPTTRINSFDLEEFKNEAPEVLKEQTRIYLTDNADYSNYITDYANHLETFSLRVLNQIINEEDKIDKDSEVLRSIIPVYISKIEELAAFFVLVPLREGNGTFTAVKKLYMLWRDSDYVDRKGMSKDQHISLLSEIIGRPLVLAAPRPRV